jgi:ABC-type bacteriocin/lantibiotic exporter with double-glycine peptidase domain
MFVFTFLARRIFYSLLLVVTIFSLISPTLTAVAQSPLALPSRADPNRINLGWAGIQRQQFDNTCGLAVLAILLNNAGLEISETQLRKNAVLTKQGMSLYEWQQLAKKYGLRGRWLEAASHTLPELPTPFVAHIKDPIGHFVIVQRVYNDHVLIADPNAGRVLFSIEAFEAVWTRRVFMVNQ